MGCKYFQTFLLSQSPEWKYPEIEPRERKTTEIEGWILGVL